MHVPKSNPILLVAVSLSLTVACARGGRSDQPQGAGPAPVIGDVKQPAARDAKADADKAKPTRAELEADFEVQQRRIEVAVERLRRDHDFYAMESSWRANVMAWWPWQKKKDRDAIGALIGEVEQAAEREVEIAKALANPDLAVRAQVERERAAQLLASLEDYNYHDHNKNQ